MPYIIPSACFLQASQPKYVLPELKAPSWEDDDSWLNEVTMDS